MILITNSVLAIIEIVLGLRFIFRLLSANPTADFVDWVYDTSAPLLDPFRGIFRPLIIEPGYVLEISTLIAMLIYGLAGYAIVTIITTVIDATERSQKRKEETK